MFSGAFVAELQSSIVAEPGESSFDDKPEHTQAAAVLGAAHEGELTANPPGSDGGDVVFGSVGSISLIDLRTEARSTSRTLDGWNGVQQVDGRSAIVDVGGGDVDDQRDPLGVRYDVAFAARLASIRGVRSGVGPPKTARMEALSTTARDQSISPARPRALRSAWCSAGQIPRTVQYASRRQQVHPLPHPNSAGSRFHGMPVFNTKTMPVKQRRSGTRGRPPLDLSGSGGSRGSICSQSSSVTKFDDMSFPLSWLSGVTHRHSTEVTSGVLH